MSVTSDLLAGIGAELTGAGVGTYPATGVAGSIYFKTLPTSPDRCIAITPYASVDEAKMAYSTFRFQLWFRGVPNNAVDVDALADSAFDVLHGLERRTYGSVQLVQLFRVSSSQLGLDASKRSERADNYEAALDMPVTALRPW